MALLVCLATVLLALVSTPQPALASEKLYSQIQREYEQCIETCTASNSELAGLRQQYEDLSAEYAQLECGGITCEYECDKQAHDEDEDCKEDFKAAKKECRQDKRQAKKDCRQEKRDAIDRCKELTGREKRECKKAARRAKRACFKEAREDKRECIAMAKHDYEFCQTWVDVGHSGCIADCELARMEEQCVDLRRELARLSELIEDASDAAELCLLDCEDARDARMEEEGLDEDCDWSDYVAGEGGTTFTIVNNSDETIYVYGLDPDGGTTVVQLASVAPGASVEITIPCGYPRDARFAASTSSEPGDYGTFPSVDFEVAYMILRAPGYCCRDTFGETSEDQIVWQVY